MRGRPALITAAGAALIAMSLIASPSASASGSSPIQPGNVPTALPGMTNGALPASVLVNVAPHCQADRDAAPSLSLLLATARDDGVELGTEECYRPLAGQEQEAQIYTAAGNPACAAPVTHAASGTPVGTSMHGWGKAADFFGTGGTASFGSVAYAFLQQHAGTFGWNHPGWAQPGGSACPEAWHWEWVGDGGTAAAAPVVADVVGMLAGPDGRGHATVTGLGQVADSGDATVPGLPDGQPIDWVITGAALTSDGRGAYLVGADASVLTTGDAVAHGQVERPLNQPVVGMAATPDGGGYWLVAADGGVFTFGDARYWGSTGALHLAKPIVGMAATPDGGGYWLAAADGGVFTFGDAHYWGSTGALHLAQPVVGMAATPDGGGYWLAAADGGVFTFGRARFLGSAGSAPLAEPVVGMARSKSGQGYWLAAADGTVHGYGDAH